MLTLTRSAESILPPTRALALALLLVAPLAAAQTTLGEVLDLGATKISADEFKRDVMQKTVVGTTPAGGTLEIMYAHSGVIAGSGTHQPGSVVRAPVNGEWAIDDNERVCSKMSIGVGAMGGAIFQNFILPRRCQFWFKVGDTYFLSESDSDRHARVVRRTVAAIPVTAAPPADPTFTLPGSLKGRATFTTRQPGAVNELALAISRTNEDGTFEGTLTSRGLRCNAKDLPIQNGVAKNGEVRFSVWMGMDCRLDFTLRKGKAHLLEGDAGDSVGFTVVGSAGRADVWFDPN
jgi:hypothetical protein